MRDLFELLDLLDRNKVWYRIERHRPDTVQINAVFVGARIEIDVFRDGHFELSRFTGNEDVESGSIETIAALIADLS